MGYIFDALNRANEPDELNHANQPKQDQTPLNIHEQASAQSAAADNSQDAAEPAPNAAPIADALQAGMSKPADASQAQIDQDTIGTVSDTTEPANHTAYAAAAMDNFDEFDDTMPTSPIGRIHNLDVDKIDERLMAVTSVGSLVSEEYRSIRTGILARWHQRRALVHTITSATPQEGKTITSLNLGFSFAEIADRKTIVVECDLRLPQFQKLLNLPEGPGAIGVLSGENTLEESVIQLGEHKLNVLPAGGRASNNAVQLLSSPRFGQLLDRLRAEYDHIIIDTPPVVELADAGIIGAHSDEVILIARMQRTPRGLIEQAVRILKSYNAPVAGAIATDQMRTKHRYHYYRYGYRYRSRYYTKAA